MANVYWLVLLTISCGCLIKTVANFLESKFYLLINIQSSAINFTFRYSGHKLNNLNIESDIITNDNYVLSGSVSGELWCWDLVSAEVKHKFTHTKNKALNSLSVHPRKDIVLTASVTTVKLWGEPEVVEAEVDED